MTEADQQDAERMKLFTSMNKNPPALHPCDNHPECTGKVWGKWAKCSGCLRKEESNADRS